MFTSYVMKLLRHILLLWTQENIRTSERAKCWLWNKVSLHNILEMNGLPIWSRNLENMYKLEI